MQHSQTHLRTRPISAGHLRAFEAVARHLNFRAASEEMALTQSAVSQHVAALERARETRIRAATGEHPSERAPCSYGNWSLTRSSSACC